MSVGETQQQTLRQAVALHRAGRLAEAEAVDRAIVAAKPEHEDALRLLGRRTRRCGHVRSAARRPKDSL
jgi:hypothetical protein